MSSPEPFPPDTPAQALMYPIHGITLTVVWCLGADALLLIVRYYKNWRKHLLMHSLFTIINVLTVIVVVIVVVLDSSWLWNWQGFSTMGLATQIHFILGLLFTVVVVGVQILGIVMKREIQSVQDPPEKIVEKRKYHKIFGYVFYAISKIELLIGWFIYGPGGWTPMMTVLIVYYAVFFSVRFVFFDRLYLRKSDHLYHSCFNGQPKTLMPEYESIAEMIENGLSKRSILQEYPKVKYVIYKDRLYDVSGLLHPGGMFIIKRVVGQEISRYIHGAYGLEVSRADRHDHSIYAKRWLDEMFVLELDLSRIKLFKPLIGEKTNLPVSWRLQKTSYLSADTSVFEFVGERYHVHAAPNILYLGRHFILTPVNGSLPPRLYTLTLCMSTVHRAHVQKICKALDNTQQMEEVEQLPNEIAELPFVIKQYKVKGFSEYIHTLPINGQVRIEGPFGRGLELEKGNFFAFCGGTGVLPLLDLIYEILLEVYRRASGSNTPARLPEGFRFTLYLSINTPEDLKGLDIIPLTYGYCRKLKLDLLQLFLRVSKGDHPQNIPRLESRLDENQLTRVVGGNDITTALVCGSPQMNYTVGNCLIKLLGQERVHIL